jgi:hypothetical protein
VDVNQETATGAALLMASGGLFYVVMDAAVVGALLLSIGAWAMIVPRFLQSDESQSW